MDHWKSECPELKKRSKSSTNDKINLIPFKFNGPIASIKETEKVIQRRKGTTGQKTVPKNHKNHKNQNFGIKFNDKYFKEGTINSPKNEKNEHISGSSEDDEMTIEELKTSEFNKEVDKIINTMPNESKSTQFKHLKGIVSQSQEIISEKILISGKNKTKTASSYIDYNMMLNSPSAMADGNENSSPQIK
ncbi:hypothetical protein AYI68_g3401, partial [Smittium mucronatum]